MTSCCSFGGFTRLDQTWAPTTSNTAMQRQVRQSGQVVALVGTLGDQSEISTFGSSRAPFQGSFSGFRLASTSFALKIPLSLVPGPFLKDGLILQRQSTVNGFIHQMKDVRTALRPQGSEREATVRFPTTSSCAYAKAPGPVSSSSCHPRHVKIPSQLVQPSHRRTQSREPSTTHSEIQLQPLLLH